LVVNGVEIQRTAIGSGEKSDVEEASQPKPARLGFTVWKGRMEFRNIQIAE
jgi:hypothetical protein